MRVNLAYLLKEQAAVRPHATALLDGSSGALQRVTFAQLERGTGQAAALLRQQGLAAGDRVLLFHPMAAELYVALGALFRLGLTALFVDPSAGREHIDRCCRLARPAAMLATPKAHLLRLASDELQQIHVKFASGVGAPGAVRWARRQGMEPDAAIAECTPQTPGLATFTSGSTGLPKMAVRSHGFLRAQHDALEETLGLGEDDIVLSTLPVFVLSHVASGACTLIPNVDVRHPGRVKAGPLVRQIAQERVNCIEGSPALFERIVRRCTEDVTRLPGVRKVFAGGAPVFPGLMQRLQEVMPHAAITAVYGSTEAEPIAHVTLDEIGEEDIRAMTGGAGLLAGRVVSAAQVRIIPDRWGQSIGPFEDTAFDEQCLDAGKPGEIVVSGPHVLRGYWQGQGDVETKFRVDDTVWHRTGDAGYFDGQGRLWLLGRCVAKIEDEGGALYPFAVECAAHWHARVKYAAFVAHNGRRLLALELYDTVRGNPVQDGSAGRNVAQALRNELAWARVEEVRILHRMPVDKRHNAKVDYGALRRVLG
jgi:olefin beta-lactone synthetase